MALIDPPSTRQIYDRVNLQFNAYGMDSKGDVRRLIATTVLDGAVARVEIAADDAAKPYQWPLSVAQVVEAEPEWTDAEAEEWIDKQNKRLQNAMLNFAAADLRLMASRRTSGIVEGDPNQAWADRVEANAQAILDAAVKSISDVAKKTTEGQEISDALQSGVVVFSRSDGYSVAATSSEYA